MSRRPARVAAIAERCSALAALPAPAAAQHDHHGVPAGNAQTLVTGTACGAEGAPSSGAVVQLFHGSGPGRHLTATAVADATFTQESRRRTARPLLSLFASYAVGGAAREDAPVR